MTVDTLEFSLETNADARANVFVASSRIYELTAELINKENRGLITVLQEFAFKLGILATTGATVELDPVALKSIAELFARKDGGSNYTAQQALTSIEGVRDYTGVSIYQVMREHRMLRRFQDDETHAEGTVFTIGDTPTAHRT